MINVVGLFDANKVFSISSNVVENDGKLFNYLYMSFLFFFPLNRSRGRARAREQNASNSIEKVNCHYQVYFLFRCETDV